MKNIFASILLSLGLATAASAQGIPVIDATNIAQRQAEAAQNLAQLVKDYEQAVQMYDSVNGITDMDDVVSLLNKSSVRELIGTDVGSAAKLFTTDIDDLDDLSSAAQKVYKFSSLDSTDTTADGFYQSEVNRIKSNISRNAAIGERIMDASDDRLEGLETLRQQIGTTSTQKEVDALNARIGIETAMLQNDQVRVQGMAMMQTAQTQAEEQRETELRTQQRETESAAFTSYFGSAD